MSTTLLTYTLIHVALSLVGLGAGFVVLRAFMRGQRLHSLTNVFLVATLATSLTGFGFRFVRFLPAHGVGIASVIVLALAVYARNSRRLAGSWSTIFVLSCVALQFFNSIVLIAQIFRRVPVLHALAPTESEPPFFIAQVAGLLVYIVLGRAALRGVQGTKAGAANAAVSRA